MMRLWDLFKAPSCAKAAADKSEDRRSDSGFTLVEVVVTIVLLSVIAMVGVPKIAGALNSIRLNTAAQKVMNDIRYVREMALSYHDTYGLEFDTIGNSYQIFQVVGATKTVVTDPHRNKPMIIDFDNLSEFSGVSISSANVCEGGPCFANEIRIDAFGIPFDSEGTQFLGLATITLQSGGLTKTIQVTQTTAFTEVV